MKQVINIAVILFTIASITLSQTNNYQYVSTLIGTGGEGYGIGSLPTGAQIPYGMMRLGPDTTNKDDFFADWRHYGGYYHGDDHIGVLSHTHTVGAGVPDYGTTGVMPIAEAPTRELFTGKYPFREKFSHETEIAQPGYYSAILDQSNITIELTATSHVGVHRYTYNHGFGVRYQDKIIAFQSSYTLKEGGCGGSSLYINTSSSVQEVNGWVHNNGGLSARFGGMIVYFVAQFNTEFESFGVWNDTGDILQSINQINGTSSGGYIVFPKHTKSVEMYLGISFLSIDQARINLNYELGEQGSSQRSFDQVHSNATNIWTNILNTVQINDPNVSSQNLTVFYSALYHSYLSPTLFSEIGNVYLGFDDQEHKLPCNYTQQPYVYSPTSESTINNCAYYTDMSIWDTYRTEFPWLTLMQPYVMRDIAQSLVYMYEQGGDLPRWPMANGYTNCMIGTHADIVLADAATKNIPFDYETAYAGMYQGATEQQQYAGKSGIEYYMDLGYVPCDVDTNGCSETLEYSYDDWSCLIMAEFLGKTNDIQLFQNRSQNYRTQWSSDIGFMCPRYTNGTFNCPKSVVYPWDDRYTEGNAWQWRWYVPYDAFGLMSLFTSEDDFITQLNTFFAESEKIEPNILPNPFYWAGNEPDIFAPYLFLWTSRPDLTQQYVRAVLNQRFSDQPRGLPGNDDYGTMSAWILWGMIGIYPLAGNATYMIGSPSFANVTLRRDLGDINVIAYNASLENVYVEKAQINGVDIPTPFITFDQIENGATLEFTMSPTPTSLWVGQNNYPFPSSAFRSKIVNEKNS